MAAAYNKIALKLKTLLHTQHKIHTHT